ncbi:hypothetical protein EHI8A_081150 [Entamoeba histolytica HM-1:IMSS-B]|uniref:Uncharacterized protein n=8 Tax=Entamoeba TaxID=5758 RepID=C4MBB1_ENTH1|nr:hypothetical protein ENU1_161650 [Entamoeba nuttalli P19]XP_648065.1 hypothetical protein EHI_002780 [Entamoeba histolytica HM-1:IMSS]EMD43418.1 Hypothetical protein EHI5A_105510 [Entamoeba histolytica KU27]EMH77615.1 hypothetical protein EHI8A_081150 [Entamoeba histolytica HM-1:IMSS-B]EMS15658.1 hypothetical protein KM1_144720 [Entamoeba histolytica HM-3:IMSS]ENY60211.1 hypothetical protein EHI7A_079330 [Entamoeba histolytica HM-1:IMSS-A]GAT99237.1 hypothetical protein CL6EHI_002780 [Enta|eukprot:XP_008859072.1 hypothetical protein ENU1_161650 [Entamoeba nuttalli P19]
MAMNCPYQVSYYPTVPFDYCDIGEIREDSSDDDASIYITNSTFSFQSTSYESRMDEQIQNNERSSKKFKDFTAWVKKLARNTSTHKMYICGSNASIITKKWLEEIGKSASIVQLSDVRTPEFLNAIALGDIVIVEVPNINSLTDNLDTFKNFKQNNIIVCCTDIKNCPKNKGASFSAVFKRISLK